jgi:hypothetical protein
MAPGSNTLGADFEKITPNKNALDDLPTVQRIHEV